MSEKATLFAEAIRHFHDANVRFVVIGGVAMGLHGSDYLTHDVDLAYAPEPENLDHLAAALSAIHSRIIGQPAGGVFSIDSRLLLSARFLNLSTDLGAIDVIREIAGVDSFDGIWQRATAMFVAGVEVQVASLDDLIAMKQAVSRPKDRAHVYELLALKSLSKQQDSNPQG